MLTAAAPRLALLLLALAQVDKRIARIGPSTTSNLATLRFDAPNMRCPTRVDKKIWSEVPGLEGLDYRDDFAVTTTSSASGTLVKVRRTDTSGGWAMDLAFYCIAAESRFGPKPVEVVIGSQLKGKRTKWVTVRGASSLECPRIAYRRNWLSDADFPIFSLWSSRARLRRLLCKVKR